MFVSRESKGKKKKKEEEFRAKAGRVAKVNENMYLLTREGESIFCLRVTAAACPCAL